MILPIKKILCPTDFSQPSYEGLKAANELADHFSAELIIVHVMSLGQLIAPPSEPAGALVPQIIREIEESAKNSLERVVREKTAKHLKTSWLLLQGSPSEEIAKTADNVSADLIVIATHGQSGWKKFISGSVTERVVRLAERPVLTIHAPEPE